VIIINLDHRMPVPSRAELIRQNGADLDGRIVDEEAGRQPLTADAYIPQQRPGGKPLAAESLSEAAPTSQCQPALNAVPHESAAQAFPSDLRL
jgi:hypothetical protein